VTERVLVIGAHCDDESFGMLGTLLKHKKAGHLLDFMAFTGVRGAYKGYAKMTNYFTAPYVFQAWTDQQLDSYDFTLIVSTIENLVKITKPTIVYCPFIGDLNRDHRIVAEATMVACRPYKNGAPKEVWMYQIPGSTELGLREFRKDRTELIDQELKRKLIKAWYPGEMINGREYVSVSEHFERWPK
jgi:LmbE family N-acetylglucosaminyl deacetylase